MAPIEIDGEQLGLPINSMVMFHRFLVCLPGRVLKKFTAPARISMVLETKDRRRSGWSEAWESR